MNTHVTGKRCLVSFINQLISWYILTVQLSWSGCRIFPPATYGARCRLHPYSWVKKKTHQKSRLKQSILSSTIGRPAYSQLRSPLKAASIRSLPACEGMTDVLASTHYSNTYFKNYSIVHCQAWRKWYLVNFQMEYREYMAIHFPIVAQIKRNRGTGNYEWMQFIWINYHQNPFTILKCPLKFTSLSTLSPPSLSW